MEQAGNRLITESTLVRQPGSIGLSVDNIWLAFSLSSWPYSDRLVHMFDRELGAKVAQFHALAAELAAAVNADLSGRLAVEFLPEVLAGVRQGELATVRLIERADRSGEYRIDGAASVTAFVRRTANENNGWASRRIHVGRALADSLPATLKAFECGELGLEHAAVIDAATKKLLDTDLIAAMDTYLAGLAAVMTPKELAAAAEDLRSQAVPEVSAKETAKKRAAQTLHLSQTMDGMWRLDGWFDAENGLILSAAIASFLRKPVPGGDLLTESVGRRRADALVDVCRQGVTHHATCDSPGPSRHTIVVGLTHQQLLDGLGTAAVSGGGNLPAGAARRMACDADLIPAVYGGNSELLDYGRAMRTVSAGLRRVLNTRDGGCIFTGCDRTPAACEAHHRKPWQEQRGPTKDKNLDLLCIFHHHLVHEGGWRMTIDTDKHRTPWFHPPDGRPPQPGQRHGLHHRSHHPLRT